MSAGLICFEALLEMGPEGVGHSHIKGRILFQMLLPPADSPDFLKAVRLNGISQSPPAVVLVVVPRIMYG